MTPDPYKALGLPHSATPAQIKVAYRKLALIYHPDRLTRRKASPGEIQVATNKFAEISVAYQLLSDERRKKDYDHVYKYGGFDDAPPSPPSRHTSQPTTFHQGSTPPRPTQPPPGFSPFPQSAQDKKRSTGIGYTVTDPFSYLFTCGNKQSAAVAGIQIPSRMHLVHPPPGGGFRIAFSSGQYKKKPNGSKVCVSKTTQFVQGKKYTRVETTTLYPDGRKEVVIEGNDYVQRKISTPPKRKKSKVAPVAAKKEEPWYTCAWNEIRHKLTMCHNPCSAVLAQ